MLNQIKIAYAETCLRRSFPHPDCCTPCVTRCAAGLRSRQASSRRSQHLTNIGSAAGRKTTQGDEVGEGNAVLVIGGGPAGLAAAIAARMKGFDVTVADGVKPPIDKACGEGLLPGTIAALRELGVAISPDDGQAFRGVCFVDAANSAEASFSGASGFGVRRTVLHQKMVERAQQCGITLLWNTPVTGF